MSEAKILHEGWGTKLGGIFKTWRVRWFTLTKSSLTYSKSKNSRIKGKIDLSKVKEVSPMPDCVYPNAFKVVIPGVRTYQIHCNSPDEMKNWVSIINKVLSGKNINDITADDFEILKVIGKGSYGKVQLVKLRNTNDIYAMKSISKKLLGEYELISRIITERNVVLKINHPFLISARYAFQNDTKIFLVLDYAQGGELYSRLKEEQKFCEERVKYYCAMLAMAIGYLHSMGICYRDLKPENILFDKDGYIKLTDFGLVKEHMAKEDKTETFCGTPEYVAPEIIMNQPYDNSVDWWSLGTLAYEMLFGVPPFYNLNINAMYRAICRDEVDFPQNASKEAVDFIIKLLDKDPKSRLGSGPADYKDVLAHPSLAGLSEEALYKKQIPMKWKPKISSKIDVSHFDKEFTREAPKLTYEDPTLVDDNVQHQLQGFSLINGQETPDSV
ncbi:AGC family protein kinase [Trichomonas vaginalis G3]|uniref:non-specific serine/threonine protein kinase n=1 Tax=Trichomonas vaginalis (strain ATCC PRA-98 / G3) TaxID=412133 RepID=A2F4A4_TRIV3|nr:glycogen cell differentiation involved in embryonic placenta development [Trichomonas vaginalis G3]EAY00283.1 AGC family protein kinase [Trichomonas vaginalis G3]KAI5492715.1 glycogen cell differentiation involved in embryonic placenta development [Trichomonas vaginalis G3]|eukprot:XP_001313212.1 AGC family protein kinase [Trichomonas vaginalis G3]